MKKRREGAIVMISSVAGIRGVPFFVIDSKYGLSGAQEADRFLEALAQVQSERKSGGQ